MARCDDMREGDVYRCERCGLEIEVVEECSHDEEDADETCRAEEFVCCGEPMTLVEED